MNGCTHVVFAPAAADRDDALDAGDALLDEDALDAGDQVLQGNSFLGVDGQGLELRLVARHDGGQRDVAAVRRHDLRRNEDDSLPGVGVTWPHTFRRFGANT